MREMRAQIGFWRSGADTIHGYAVEAKWTEAGGWVEVDMCDTEEEALNRADWFYEDHYGGKGVAVRVRNEDGDVIETWGEGAFGDGNPY